MSHPVLDQLPAWIEGDLEPTEQAAVAAHLDHCPDCREAAEDLRRSQAWLREAMASPFDAADQDRLRRTVMDQIRTESTQPIRRLALRPALWAACAAALLLTTWVWRQEQPAASIPTLGQPSSMKSAPVMVQPLPMQAQANPAPAVTHHTTPHAAREAPSLPHEEPVRIEIQTADPTIRIIWLAQAKPLPDTNPHTQESL